MKDTKRPSALALEIARQHYGLLADREIGPDEPGTEDAADLAAIIDTALASLRAENARLRGALKHLIETVDIYCDNYYGYMLGLSIRRARAALDDARGGGPDA